MTRAKRVESRSDLWEITVEPDSHADVTIVLPITKDCDAEGAVCTGGGAEALQQFGTDRDRPGCARADAYTAFPRAGRGKAKAGVLSATPTLVLCGTLYGTGATSRPCRHFSQCSASPALTWRV